MRIIQISDTHGKHQQLKDIPEGDVLIHCGDFTEDGTEEEVLDFINWFEELPYPHKIFVTGNHDLCLQDVEGIEDLQTNMHFLQDRGVVINGIRFFGLACWHDESLIPEGTDVIITHEPPLHILDKAGDINWGNLALKERVMKIHPRYHLFGHAHSAYGTETVNGIVFSNGSILDHNGKIIHNAKVFEI